MFAINNTLPPTHRHCCEWVPRVTRVHVAAITVHILRCTAAVDVRTGPTKARKARVSHNRTIQFHGRGALGRLRIHRCAPSHFFPFVRRPETVEKEFEKFRGKKTAITHLIPSIVTDRNTWNYSFGFDPLRLRMERFIRVIDNIFYQEIYNFNIICYYE